MTSVYLELFTSPTCPYCSATRKILQELIEDKDLEGKIITDEFSVDTIEGQQKALSYGITAVPTLIINYQKVVQGVPNKHALKKTLMEELDPKRFSPSYYI